MPPLAPQDLPLAYRLNTGRLPAADEEDLEVSLYADFEGSVLFPCFVLGAFVVAVASLLLLCTMRPSLLDIVPVLADLISCGAGGCVLSSCPFWACSCVTSGSTLAITSSIHTKPLRHATLH